MELDTDLEHEEDADHRTAGGYFAKEDVPLGTFKEAKDFYCSVINDYRCGRMPRDRARSLGYLLGGLLTYFKLGMDQEILTRIEALEELIKERKL